MTRNRLYLLLDRYAAQYHKTYYPGGHFTRLSEDITLPHSARTDFYNLASLRQAIVDEMLRGLPSEASLHELLTCINNFRSDLGPMQEVPPNDTK